MLALAVLASVEFGVSRSDWSYRMFPSSYVGEFLALEKKLRANTIAPVVLLLGDSRTQCGILPRVLEQELGEPSGSVWNAALSSGDTFDAYLIHDRNRDRFKAARVVVFCVDAYQFNDGLHFIGSRRLQHFGSLADRQRLDRSTSSILGYFFHTLQERKLFLALGRRLLVRLHRSLASEVAPDSLAEEEPAPPLWQTDVRERIRTFYKDFQLSSGGRHYLEVLLSRCRADGQQVILIEMPFRDAYMAELKASRLTEYNAYRSCVLEVDPQTVFFEEGSRYGLQAGDFRDWDHLDEKGARKFSVLFAAFLRARCSGLGTGRL